MALLLRKIGDYTPVTSVDSVFGMYSLANYAGFRAATPHGVGSDAYYASRPREVEKLAREYFRIF